MSEITLSPISGGETKVIGRHSCLRCRALVSGRVWLHVCAGQGKRPGGQVRKRVCERDGWVCQLCGDPVDPRLPRAHPCGATLDHRIPRADGGRHGDDNLQLAHALCNSLRAREPIEGVDLVELRERIRAQFALAFERYLRTHPHGRPEDVLATLERRQQRRREAKARRRERRAAARALAGATPAMPEPVL